MILAIQSQMILNLTQELLSNLEETNMKQGFSLIELLVVVAIIGILAAVGTVGYQNYIDGTRDRVAQTNAETVAKALNAESLRIASGIDGDCTDLGTCITALFGDFENPYAGSATPYINEDTAANICATPADADNAGRIYVDNATPADSTVGACDATGAAPAAADVTTVDLTDL